MQELDDIYAALARMRLIDAAERPLLEPLMGGVSSEIYRLQMGDSTLCVKRSLPQLKVKQEWLAPIERGDYEVAWFRAVEELAPKIVPHVIAADPEAHLFAMTYLPPADYPVWKQMLLDGVADSNFAGMVGHMLGLIHRSTAGDPRRVEQFDNDYIFDPIRVDPYLRATARAHPECSTQLLALADRTLEEKHALVHGDVSPKNILVGPEGPVFLDAECAWYGDPAFDLAFCLNHLLLKCVWRRDVSGQYLASFDALAAKYLAQVNWEPVEALEARAATLLSAFLLARIDGKSPLEYITKEPDKAMVRAVAVPLIQAEVGKLDQIRETWAERMLA